MASLAAARQKKAFTPDAQTTRFLYLILKQLDAKGDLKTVSWQEIADNIGIKNGHAARMRWSRFKQHAEGAPPQPKPTKPKKTDAEKNGKRDRSNNTDLKADDDRDEKRIKLEQSGFVPNGLPPYGFHPLHPPYPMPMPMPMPIKPEPSVKMEPGIDFNYRASSASSPPPTPFLWQPPSQPRLPPSSCPGLTPDEDSDDIPIKQLNSSHHVTVSLSDLQLNSPIKPEFDVSITSLPLHDIRAQSAAPGLAGPDREAVSACANSPDPQQDNSVQPDLSSAKITDKAHRKSTPSPAFTPNPAVKWLPQHNAAFQPGHQPYYPPYPPYYRPHPFHLPYHSPYTHPPLYPMGFQQRPTLQLPNTVGAQGNQDALSLPQGLPLQGVTVPKTQSVLQQGNPQASSLTPEAPAASNDVVRSSKVAEQVAQQPETPDQTMSDVATEAVQAKRTLQLDADGLDEKTVSPSAEPSKMRDGEVGTPSASSVIHPPAPQPVSIVPSSPPESNTTAPAAGSAKAPSIQAPGSPPSEYTPTVHSESSSTDLTKHLAPAPSPPSATTLSTPKFQTQPDARPPKPLPQTQTPYQPQPEPHPQPPPQQPQPQQPQPYPHFQPRSQAPYTSPHLWWPPHPTAPYPHPHSPLPSYQYQHQQPNQHPNHQQPNYLAPPIIPTNTITANTLHTDAEDDPFAFDFDFSSIQDDLNCALEGQIPVSIPMPVPVPMPVSMPMPMPMPVPMPMAMEPQFVIPDPASVLSGEMVGTEEKTEGRKECMEGKTAEKKEGMDKTVEK